MATLLAGDIGGTKTLLSLHPVREEITEPIAQERYASADWPDLASMVETFLGAVMPPGSPSPQAACFAVAGPVKGGCARLTNLPWQLSESELSDRCGIPSVELVNDFAVLIYGLPHLQGHQVACVRDGEGEPDAPLLVLGAGTGLGVALGVPTAAGLQAVASEGAHGEFAARTDAEWALKRWLLDDLGLERVSIERVVSGTGLGHVGRWLLANRHPRGDHPLSDLARRWADECLGSGRGDLPAELAMAAERGDPLASEALALWLGAYGSVTGDLALGSLSRGGIWLAGGTAPKLLGALRSDRFMEAFLAKGRLRQVLAAIPIHAILDPSIGSFSAACRARMLLG
jgi:glucokinase